MYIIIIINIIIHLGVYLVFVLSNVLHMLNVNLSVDVQYGHIVF